MATLEAIPSKYLDQLNAKAGAVKLGEKTILLHGNRVLVKLEAAPEKSPGGILYPQAMAKDNSTRRGVVMAVGTGDENDAGKLVKPPVCIGETVVLGRWAGNEVEIDGEKMLIAGGGEILMSEA